MATDVRLLPQGTVIFEDISIEQFEGTVVKVIPKVPSKNQASRFFIYFLPTNQSPKLVAALTSSVDLPNEGTCFLLRSCRTTLFLDA